MSKFENKFGKYAVKNLTLILIVCYVCGYIINFINPDFFKFLTLNPYMILHGQIWRLLTWVIAPPSAFGLFTIIMLLCYYSLGSTLERIWGDYNYNIYIFSGILFTIIGTFIVYFGYILILKFFPSLIIDPRVLSIINDVDDLYKQFGLQASAYVSTMFINLSIFLAFSATVPDTKIYLYFVIPIKVKWLGIVYAVFILYSLFVYRFNPFMVIMVVASLLNFVIFFFKYRKQRMNLKHLKRKIVYTREVNRTVNSTAVSVNVCAKCGARSDEHPDYTYRYCSKCKGNLQYCQEHLFSHIHVE